MRPKGSDTSKLTCGVVPRLPKAPGSCGWQPRKPLMKEHPWWTFILWHPVASVGILWPWCYTLQHWHSFPILSYLISTESTCVTVRYFPRPTESVCAALLDAFWPAPQLKQNRSRTKASQLCFCRCKHRRIGEDLGRNTTGICCIGSMGLKDEKIEKNGQVRQVRDKLKTRM